MTDLNFEESLTVSKFSNNNHYHLGYPKSTGLRFFKDTENLPFIMCSPYQSNHTELQYSDSATQFRNRLLNTAKIKDVMNSSPLPLIVKIKGVQYLIGKGFLAQVAFNEFEVNMNLLFVACINSSKRHGYEMKDVRFFISRAIYTETYKPVSTAVRDIIENHIGDVIFTSDIQNKIGDVIPFQRGGTLVSRNDYKKAIVMEAIRDFFSPDHWL